MSEGGVMLAALRFQWFSTPEEVGVSGEPGLHMNCPAEAPLPCSPSSAPPPHLHCSGSFGEAVWSAAPFALDGSGSVSSRNPLPSRVMQW